MKKFAFIFAILVSGTFVLNAQSSASADNARIFVKTEPAEKAPVPLHLQNYHPQFPGGEEAMNAFVANALEYPARAKYQAVEGTVIAAFTVEADGSIHGIHIEQGLGLGCDEAASEMVRNMPNWQPAIQAGRPVRSSVRIPILFHLD